MAYLDEQLPASQPNGSSRPKRSSEYERYQAQNRKIWGWLNLLAAILLFYFMATNFGTGKTFLPMGFGLMGFYCLYIFAQKALKVKFSKAVAPFNLLLLLVALVCLVIGLINNN